MKQPDYALAFEEAHMTSRGRAEYALYERAVIGTLEPVIANGQQVWIMQDPNDTDPKGPKKQYWRREYDNRLLETHLRAEDPEKYGHKTPPADALPGNTQQVVVITGGMDATATAAIEKMREALRAQRRLPEPETHDNAPSNGNGHSDGNGHHEGG